MCKTSFSVITVGLSPLFYKVLFFTLLSACVVAALQTVGAILVIAMVITPGATAYLLTDKFKTLIKIAVALGAITGFVGVYLSYYLDGATGGVIVTLQTLLFFIGFSILAQIRINESKTTQGGGP